MRQFDSPTYRLTTNEGMESPNQIRGIGTLIQGDKKCNQHTKWQETKAPDKQYIISIISYIISILRQRLDCISMVKSMINYWTQKTIEIFIHPSWNWSRCILISAVLVSIKIHKLVILLQLLAWGYLLKHRLENNTHAEELGAYHIPDSKVHGPTWGPPGADGTQVGPMVAPWFLLTGYLFIFLHIV